MHTREDLDERRLARAVAADERVDLATPHVERDAVQRLGSQKGLRDSRHAQDGLTAVLRVLPVLGVRGRDFYPFCAVFHSFVY